MNLFCSLPRTTRAEVVEQFKTDRHKKKPHLPQLVSGAFS